MKDPLWQKRIMDSLEYRAQKKHYDKTFRGFNKRLLDMYIDIESIKRNKLPFQNIPNPLADNIRNLVIEELPSVLDMYFKLMEEDE